MIRRLPLILLFFVSILVSESAGQEYALSFYRPPSQIESLSMLGFERLLNSMTWTGAVRLDRDEGPWAIRLEQRYRSRLIRGPEQARQDEYSGMSDVHVPLSSRLWGTVTLASLVVSENRAVSIGHTAQHRLMGGLEVEALDRLRFGLAGGYELNTQEDQKDKGVAYSVRAEGRSLEWDEFTVGLDGQWSESLLGRRRPHTGTVRASLWRRFGPEAEDSLTVEYGNQERSFYLNADAAVESFFDVSHNLFERVADNWDLRNRLRYRMGERAVLTVDAGLMTRTIERGNRYRVPGTAPAIADWRIQELQLLGGVQLEWMPWSGVHAVAAISHTEREERHSNQALADLSPAVLLQQQALARRLENIASRTVVSTGIDAQLSESDRLQLRSSASILRYDTPDTLNTDDRDELYVTVRVEGEHRFSQALVLQLAADLSAAHLVYLDRMQSANNNWNRVIRLASRVEYHLSDRVHNVFRSEVIGNYTASDYAEQVASVQSFSFRQASWLDSLVIQLTDRLTASAAVGIRRTERGTLHWREFTEHPEDAAVEKQVWPRIIAVIGDWRIGIGYRYFAQDRYSYRNGVRTFVNGYESSGPAASVEWNSRQSRRIWVEGWRETQFVNGQSLATIPNLAMTVAFPL